MTYARRPLLRPLALGLALTGALLFAPAAPAKADTAPTASAPALDPDQPITLTQGDFLDLYSSLMSIQMQAMMPEKLRDAQMTMAIHLLDAEGMTTLVFSFPAEAMAKLQKSPPAEQMKALQGFHSLFWTLFTKLASGEISEDTFGDLNAGLTRPSPGTTLLQTFLAQRTLNDFVLRVGFVQDEQAHLYATVRGSGVTFSPKAPKARAN